MTATVKSASRQLVRVGIAVVLLVLIAGGIAPFVNAARYSNRIREALEASLQRKVDFGEAHFAFFSGFGFSLGAVTIHENPRYGIEPFAYVPKLEARLRIDQLLLGRIQFSSLRLVDPSLNLVKQNDGSWNIIELVRRLSAAPAVSPGLFPALAISGGRIDFKFGVRKKTLYIDDADVSIYPERFGKLYVQFAGSPARTDRAGTGFGHLHGSANLYLGRRSPSENQVEANIILDPSNVSEIATLLRGYDVGVHGTASGEARIEGPATALRVSGELRVQDVHRWDLLPAAGEQLRIAYHGGIDLLGRQLSLEAVPWNQNETTPVVLQMRVEDFLGRPNWSVLARLRKAPSENLLPLCKRMGVPLPEGVTVSGAVDGAIEYSNRSGFSGGLMFNELGLTLPDAEPLHVSFTTAKILPSAIHFDSAAIELLPDASLRVAADYYPGTRLLTASLNAVRYPVQTLTSVIAPWGPPPLALAPFQTGNVSGQLVYSHDETKPSSWSGQFDFADATLLPPGLAVPVTSSHGHITFDASTFDVRQFFGHVGDETVRANYHYNARLRHAEHLDAQLSSADLSQADAALVPALRSPGLLARLRFGRRAIPGWLAARDLEADIAVQRFSIRGASLGSLRSSLVWQGTTLRFNSVQLDLPEGSMSGKGTVNLASYSPHYRFTVAVAGFPWRSGILNANGTFETSGTGLETLRNLRGRGGFLGKDLSLSPEDAFSKVSGLFDVSFDAGWPSLRLSHVEASQGEEAWLGEAASQSDGTLIFDLENAGRQRRIISSLEPEEAAVSSALTKGGGPR